MYKKRTVYQVLVEAGLVRSKKDAVVLARSNKIVVDGEIITSLHYQFNPRKRKILVNGKLVKLEDKRRYFVFNKPEGVITTKENILSFLKNSVDRSSLFSFYPVGRLDKDTSGLLVITNDGRLGNKILNPKRKILKVYEVVISDKLNDDVIRKFSEGVEINLEENGVVRKYRTLPARIKIIDDFKVEVEISEGKKRQVRRMFQAGGCKVLKLKRVSIGNLELGDLKSGEVKEISRDDLFKLIF